MAYTGKNLTAPELLERIVLGTKPGDRFDVCQRLVPERRAIHALINQKLGGPQPRFQMVWYTPDAVTLERIY